MDWTAVAIVSISVIALVLLVWALVDLVRSPYSVGAKILWAIGIILLPILMATLYLVSRPSGRLQRQAYGSSESVEDLKRESGPGRGR